MKTHLIHYVLVYPLGQLPPGVRPEDLPDDEPIGQFEDYLFEFADQVPEVGTVQELNSNRWTIATIESYQQMASTPGRTQAVHIAVCTPDGAIPQRTELDTTQRYILYVPALMSGELARNEDGSPRFGVVADTSLNIPLNPFEGWEMKRFQAFAPESISKTGFDQIVICWCQKSTVAIAA